MGHDKLISYSFEDLAQSLRRLREAFFSAHGQNLLEIDRTDAIGNIESSLTSVLNSFHSLYDAMEKHYAKNSPLNWYNDSDLALILSVRNARHHNLANRVRSIYKYHNDTSKNPTSMSQYVFVDFESNASDSDSFEVFISWDDLSTLLHSDRKLTRLRPEIIDSIKSCLDSDKFKQYTDYYSLKSSKLFFNIIPIFINGAKNIMPHIYEYCTYESVETALFRDVFSDVAGFNLKSHIVKAGPFVLL